MGVIKEWRCAKHGDFEATHPICPGMGCDSSEVTRIFKTAPAIKHDLTKFTDSSLQQTADQYGLTDMSNTGGKSVKGYNPGAAIWGQENIPNFEGMLKEASTPTRFVDPKGIEHYADNIGMRAACKSSGLDQHMLPPAAITGTATDAKDKARVVKAAKG